MMECPDIDEEELQRIYNWVDEIPLSRPKRNISRDFADGVLLAEIVKHFIPRLIEIHNYSSASSMQKKMYNWSTLNSKVFRKMGFQLSKKDIDSVVNAEPEAIERILSAVNIKIVDFLENAQQPSTERTSPTSIRAPVGAGSPPQRVKASAAMEEALIERETTIQELKETIEIMEVKIQKLEQLVKIKDSKIITLTNKLAGAGIDIP